MARRSAPSRRSNSADEVSEWSVVDERKVGGRSVVIEGAHWLDAAGKRQSRGKGYDLFQVSVVGPRRSLELISEEPLDSMPGEDEITELMEETYGNPAPGGGLLRGLITAGLAAAGITGIVMGVRAGRAGRGLQPVQASVRDQ